MKIPACAYHEVTTIAKEKIRNKKRKKGSVLKICIMHRHIQDAIMKS